LFEAKQEATAERVASDRTRSRRSEKINSGRDNPESELQSALERLDSSRVHFAVLGDWKDDAHILAVDESVGKRVSEFFELRGSERFVFTRER
jgi:hypothetical protein